MSTRLDWEDVLTIAQKASTECVGAKPEVQDYYCEKIREKLYEIDRKVGTTLEKW